MDVYNKMQSVDIPPHEPFSAIIVGRRASGKTTLVRDLLAKVGAKLSRSCSDDFINNIMLVIKSCECPQEYVLENKKSISVFDGSIVNPEGFESVYKAMKEKKHILLATSFLSNHMECDAVDYVCLFQEPNESMRQDVHRRFASKYMSYETFASMLDGLQSYECLMFDTKAKKYQVYKVDL